MKSTMYRTIKSLMPIPSGVTVMVPHKAFKDGKEQTVWVDVSKTPEAYCLALAAERETPSHDTYETVYPYNLSAVPADIDKDAIIIHKVRCPSCGRYMEPHLNAPDAVQTAYTCECQCGHHMTDALGSAVDMEALFWDTSDNDEDEDASDELKVVL